MKQPLLTSFCIVFFAQSNVPVYIGDSPGFTFCVWSRTYIHTKQRNAYYFGYAIAERRVYYNNTSYFSPKIQKLRVVSSVHAVKFIYQQIKNINIYFSSCVLKKL